MTNTEWYEIFNTKVEVAESVGCVFANDKTLDYYVELEYKAQYVHSGWLLKTSRNSHDKIKLDFLDDFTKGSDNYPTTPQQTLLLLDKYSKKHSTITQSEGAVFAQKEKGRGKAKKPDDADLKKFEFDRELYKDKECFHFGKKGHPKAAFTVKKVPADNDRSSKSSSSKGYGGSSDMGKMFSLMNKSLMTFGKAMSQVAKKYETISDHQKTAYCWS